MRISDWSSDLCSSDLFRFQPGPNFWRRSLDFGAISDIQEISQRIRDHHAQGQKFGPGWNLKRGRGGIREVEFHAQDRKSVVQGKSVLARVALGGRRIIKKKKRDHRK